MQNESATVKKHADGGTYSVVALHETRERWAIAITRWTTYRNAVVFEVRRVSPDNLTVRIGLCENESEARKLANKMWILDRS